MIQKFFLTPFIPLLSLSFSERRPTSLTKAAKGSLKLLPAASDALASLNVIFLQYLRSIKKLKRKKSKGRQFRAAVLSEDPFPIFSAPATASRAAEESSEAAAAAAASAVLEWQQRPRFLHHYSAKGSI